MKSTKKLKALMEHKRAAKKLNLDKMNKIWLESKHLFKAQKNP